MAYNKTKHVEAAQKYLHQGKVPQAVAEYLAVLKHEPKDQITLMTVGDLYVRQGETFQALEYFERLAQIFLSDGFITKAIAIYKKIAKLAPEENRPVERLAELYVQQGVLSEARPIYLQLAEMHQRAGRQPQAAALLRKLLEAEPDNLRVQTRLAEMSLAMGQPAEAAEAYRTAAEQLLRRGDHAAAIQYADSALQADPNDRRTTTVKARALAATGQSADAIALLKTLPTLDSGGEPTDLLLDLYLESGGLDAASELARKLFAHNPKNFAPVQRVAAVLLEAGEPDRALPLLDLVREAMTDAGEHEALSQSLLRAAERLPAQIEPREWLVDLYGRTSDSFRLPDAMADLAAAYEAAGRHDRARQVYEQLLDRDPENEVARRKYELLQGRMEPSGAAPEAESAQTVVAEPLPPPAAPKNNEPALDEETQGFLTQALTDVDLFSSYGLTQKAIDLLEVALQRAPRHTPTIERLLDLYLGAGDERRTAELAAQLQQIYTQRGDAGAAERFAELRRRFERAARLGPGDAAPASQDAPRAEQLAEFYVPVVEAEPIPEAIAEPIAEPAPSVETVVAASAPDFPAELAVHEVDLSEEWAALAASLQEADGHGLDREAEISVMPQDVEAAEEPPVFQVPVQELQPVPELAEAGQTASRAEVMETPAAPAAPDLTSFREAPEYALELDAAPPSNGSSAAILNSDDFLRELSSQLDAALPALASATPPEIAASGNSAEPVVRQSATGSAAEAASGPLSDVFDQFRAEMGEIHEEDEDLETHYNLGIAYREMGLLEEAISEFQKVAKANNQGQAFRYAMQCCTLLGLAFMEKGQPSIAAMWYDRALETPGLDQESILALRYDLGVAQELAGDTAAARKSFSQVYGMNIDYRDVAERLGALGKGS